MVPRDPLLDGERNPNRAKMMVQPVMTKSCTPFPRRTERRRGRDGVRKTSPCTSFQPESSCTPSSSKADVPLRSSRLI